MRRLKQRSACVHMCGPGQERVLPTSTRPGLSRSSTRHTSEHIATCVRSWLAWHALSPNGTSPRSCTLPPACIAAACLHQYINPFVPTQAASRRSATRPPQHPPPACSHCCCSREAIEQCTAASGRQSRPQSSTPQSTHLQVPETGGLRSPGGEAASQI